MQTCLLVAALFVAQAESVGPGNHTRYLTAGGQKRSYYLHVPPGYDAKKPTPVVVALHGAMMNGPLMASFSGLSKKADEAGFVVLYPNGTGPGGVLLTWNAGAFPGGLQKDRPDDVAFVGKALDDLATVVNVDCKRVYATGMSNGAMMAYRLAVEMPDRIAAIAPVAGTMVLEGPKITRPMPVLHVHGTKDTLVPYEGSKNRGFRFPPVEESLKPWIEADGCNPKPTVTELPTKADKLQVVRKAWSDCKCGTEVILYVVEGGGHTWPGMSLHAEFLGATTYNLSANDVMWEFFQRHPKR